MIKVSEDISVCYDGTVRNCNNNIIQFAYGNNYLNPSYTMIRKGKPCPMDVGRLVERENYNAEKKHQKISSSAVVS